MALDVHNEADPLALSICVVDLSLDGISPKSISLGLSFRKNFIVLFRTVELAVD